MGFSLQNAETVSQLSAKRYVHDESGCEVLFLKNEDKNKTFCITVATPPSESKGTPHILEHSVLCGSEKFPLKDPFSVLMKSSLNTFLNAFTSHDYTSYPAASENEKDFFNLFTVYYDAVFHPLLTEDTFARQAWHYRCEDKLILQGVVYNEMKGRYADLESTLYRAIINGVFPGTGFQNDSGGDPDQIPTLTYAELKEFHRKYYHPTNARILVYGDVSESKVFSFLDERLPKSRGTKTVIPKEAPVKKLSKVTEVYQPSEGRPEKQFIATLNWEIAYDGTLQHEILWSILEEILYGNQASVVYRALMDSGLGSRVAGFGLMDLNSEAIFSAGLKDITKADLQKVEDIIVRTLAITAETGITQEEIDGVVKNYEFKLREQVFNSSSRGIQLLSYVTPGWLYHDCPTRNLPILETLEAMKPTLTPEKLRGEIKTFLVDKKPTIVVLEPKPDHFAVKEVKEAQALADKEKSLSSQERMEIDRVAALVDDVEFDSELLLQKIPSLAINDIERSIRHFPYEKIAEGSTSILYEELPTTGITYVQLGFDALVVPPTLVSYLPLFLRALTGVGTNKKDVVKFTQEIQRETGGVSTSKILSLHRVTKKPFFNIFLEGSVLATRIEKIKSIFQEIIEETNFRNTPRLKQIISEMRSSYEQSVSTRPSHFISREAQKTLSFCGAVEEQLSGISQLMFLRDIDVHFDEKSDAITTALETIAQHLFVKNNQIFNITTEKDSIKRSLRVIQDLYSALPDRHLAQNLFDVKKIHRNIALCVPTRVSYTNTIYSLPDDLPDAAYEVVSTFVGDTYLWNEVRVAGGAYGSTCGIDRDSKLFSFQSWDDPTPHRTFDVFEQTSNVLLKTKFSPEEIVRNIIGTIGSVDQPLSPVAKGMRARNLFMFGVSNEERQKRRDEILSASAKDFKILGDILCMGSGKTLACAGPEEVVVKENFEIVKVL